MSLVINLWKISSLSLGHPTGPDRKEPEVTGISLSNTDFKQDTSGREHLLLTASGDEGGSETMDLRMCDGKP